MAESGKQETPGLEEAVATETAPTKIESTKEKLVPAEEVTGSAPAGESSVTEATTAPDILEADPEANEPGIVDDGDSGFGDTRSVDWTDSLASSIRNYRQIHGRTYHRYKEGKYNVPNDEREQSRLDLQSHLFMLMLDGKLYLAPIGDEIHNVLDVGTGTGIWAIDFADSHPQAKVIGTDLSPIQASWTPPNCEFIIDDAEEPWAFPEKFDFVHSRQMVGSFASWPKFIEEAYRGLKPGGWIELQDTGVLANDEIDIETTDLGVWYRTVSNAFDVIGRRVSQAETFAQLVKEAGFELVTEQIFKWPINTWPQDRKMKEIGLWARENLVDSLEAWSQVPVTQFLGWSLDEVKILQAKAKISLKETSNHSYWKIHVVYARKPLD